MDKKNLPAPGGKTPESAPIQTRFVRPARHRFGEGENTSIAPLAEILRSKGVDFTEEGHSEKTQIFASVVPKDQRPVQGSLTPAQTALLERTAPEPTVIGRRPAAPSGYKSDKPAKPAAGPSAYSEKTRVGARIADVGLPAGTDAAKHRRPDAATALRLEVSAKSAPDKPGVTPTKPATALKPESALAKAVEEAVRDAQEQAGVPKAASGQSAPRSGKKPKNHVIVFFSCKGGSGTTALSLNTAHAATNEHNSACLVDMDLQLGDSLAALGLTPRFNIAQACQSLAAGESFAKNLLPQHQSGISVLSQVGALDDLDKITPEIFSSLVDTARQNFDVVICDGVRDFGDNVLAVLDIADKIAIVALPEVLAIRRARWVFGILRKIGFDPADLTVVLNRTGLDSDIPLKNIEVMFAPALVICVPPDSSLVTQSLNRGVPLRELKALSPVSRAVGHLADNVLFDTVPSAVVPMSSEKKPSIFQRLMGIGKEKR